MDVSVLGSGLCSAREGQPSSFQPDAMCGSTPKVELSICSSEVNAKVSGLGIACYGLYLLLRIINVQLLIFFLQLINREGSGPVFEAISP